MAREGSAVCVTPCRLGPLINRGSPRLLGLLEMAVSGVSTREVTRIIFWDLIGQRDESTLTQLSGS